MPGIVSIVCSLLLTGGYFVVARLLRQGVPGAAQLPEVETLYTFKTMPICGNPGYEALIQEMKGKITSVGYNRDVVSDSSYSHNGWGYNHNHNQSREDAECFVIDTYGASHTLIVHLRDNKIQGRLLEDHAAELARELGVDLVSF